jgi:formamidopyrimidine-DNA glycosylase
MNLIDSAIKEMPEVCEVVLTAQYLVTKLKGRYLTGLHVVGGKYKRLQLPGKNLIGDHQPLRVQNVDSKGKFMWFELVDPKGVEVYLMNNFGLTGEWSFKKSNSDRVIFVMETDPYSKDNRKYKLRYSDARNFGLLQLTTKRDVLDSKINKLAPDLLKTDFTANDFIGWVRSYLSKSKKRATIPI